MVAGPFDLLTQTPVPGSVQLWALTEVPLGPLSYADLDALRVPGLQPGVVTWDRSLEVIPGVQVVRGYSVEFGPLPPGETGAGVAGFAIVDVGGSGPLAVVVNPDGGFYLPPYPETLVIVCTAIIARGGE